MPSTKHHTTADTSAAVDAFISGQPEPLRAQTAALREAILGSASSISEGIKWNAPSYKTHEYFATTNLRAKSGIGLVLHFGAKAREVNASPENISDPTGLLRWIAKDRATLAFRDADDIQAHRAALQAIVRQWIEHV